MLIAKLQWRGAGRPSTSVHPTGWFNQHRLNKYLAEDRSRSRLGIQTTVRISSAAPALPALVSKASSRDTSGAASNHLSNLPPKKSREGAAAHLAHRMALRCSLPATCSTFCLRGAEHPNSRATLPARLVSFGSCPGSRPRVGLVLAASAWEFRASEPKTVGRLVIGGGPCHDDTNSESSDDDDDDEPPPMTDEERKKLRSKIREMMDRMPEMQELTDPEEKKAKMRELLTKYELVVEEEDPEWPEDADDGMGFGLGQFFDKITIKAEKRDDDANDDDAGDGTKKEIVWEDDNYITQVRDVKTKDWDDTVFTDFGPLIVLVHNRYKRPQENVMARNELVKAIETFWEHDLPSPRCVAVDACAEPDLVAALKVSSFPELLFTNAGRILHREKAVRSAEVLARMIAFFYYKAARPPCLSESDGQGKEKVPLMS
ncbi:thioredoxin-like fold domain-containing protein MRL7L homolog, chloroplastic [Lolium rigidum]|uniref:thioredoxin-like fold domain-containing protein MRL7L homolog, chloroplastic n=1 Tax=Lolium rigidum TaxID=89674 RepID=UPI001F5D75E4|nr:thioredoxin-like fold domain-containing protein MRL7L homolog, chloroplastic [Lolium rigidum]